MIFVQGHKGGMDAAALAVASQHIAQQSCEISPQFEFRYQ